jgi:hypothetical protein
MDLVVDKNGSAQNQNAFHTFFINFESGIFLKIQKKKDFCP